MPGCAHPVYFSRSAPFDVNSGVLIFYDVVEPGVMARSDVLSCIAAGDREAKLPESITVSDFRNWVHAVTDSEAIIQSRPLVYVLAIVKVAEAVDDKHIDAWVRIAAKALALKMRSCSDSEKIEITEALMLLSARVQRLIYEAAAFDQTQLALLLDFFPTSLHPAVLAGVITANTVFSLPLNAASYPALKALTSLPPSTPPPLSLRIDDDSSNHGRYQVAQHVWSHLTKIFRSHSGLTSLHLSSSGFTAISNEHLLAQVSTLTSLQSLHLKGCIIFFEESSSAFKAALHALPQLRDLQLRIGHNPSLKRQREEEAPPRRCLADTLSTVTALTSLHIQVDKAAFSGYQSFFTAAAPLHMPQLVQLSALFENDVHLSAAFCSHLSAPLTSLTLGEGLQMPRHVPPSAADDAGHLLRSLAAFTQLRRISATLPKDQRRSRSVQNALLSALPTPLTALLQLQSVSIAAAPTVLQRAVTLLATTALTQLHLGPACNPDDTLYLTNSPAAFEWPDFFRCLCSFKLHALHLDFRAVRLTGYGLAALSTLTQLTALSIHGWSCLGSPDDEVALYAMTQLQQLRLDHTSEGFQVTPQFVESLHDRSALTHLLLKTSEPGLELVSELEGAPLPALRELTVALYDPFEAAEALGRYMGSSEVPELRQVTVHLYPSSKPAVGDHYWCDDGDEGSENSPEERVREVGKSLTEAVAHAGIQLTIIDET